MSGQKSRVTKINRRVQMPGESIEGMEDQGNSPKRVIAGGLFALFVALVVASLTVFGVISMNLGHFFMFAAAIVGAIIICTEVIPSKPSQHKIAFTLLLWCIFGGADYAIVKHKRAEAVSPKPSLPVEAQVKNNSLNSPKLVVERTSPMKSKPEGRTLLKHPKSRPTEAPVRTIKAAVLANRMKSFGHVMFLIENDAKNQLLAEQLVSSLQLGGLNASLFGTIYDPQRFSFEGIRVECNESPLGNDDLSGAAADILAKELRDENFVANKMPPRGAAKNFVRIVLGDN